MRKKDIPPLWGADILFRQKFNGGVSLFVSKHIGCGGRSFRGGRFCGGRVCFGGRLVFPALLREAEVFGVGEAKEDIDKGGGVIDGHAEEGGDQVADTDEKADQGGLVKALAAKKHPQQDDGAGNDIQRAGLDAEELGVLQKLVVGGADVVGVQQALDAEAQPGALVHVLDCALPEAPSSRARPIRLERIGGDHIDVALQLNDAGQDGGVLKAHYHGDDQIGQDKNNGHEAVLL